MCVKRGVLIGSGFLEPTCRVRAVNNPYGTSVSAEGCGFAVLDKYRMCQVYTWIRLIVAHTNTPTSLIFLYLPTPISCFLTHI